MTWDTMSNDADSIDEMILHNMGFVLDIWGNEMWLG
jgi:hypothetical protein